MSNQEQTTASQGTGVDQKLQTSTIFETAQAIPEISTFVTAILAAGLENDLRTPDFKTLFAPSNEALARMKPDQIAAMAARHIVIGRQTQADLRTAGKLRTLAGEEVEAGMQDGRGTFGGAMIVRYDIPCVNGQIHVIDKPAS